MPAWMLDTVALIDYYHGRRGVLPYLDAILEGEATGAFSTITELELWRGVRPSEEARRFDLCFHSRLRAKGRWTVARLKSYAALVPNPL